MSETTLGREPVQVLEILTPKCANTQGTAPCTAAETGDDRCFNTRNTCTDVNNFQAIPLFHLDADLTLAQGETGSQTENGDNDYIVEIDLRVPSDPSGVLFEIGSGTDGIYIGFNSGNLVARCGDGGSPGANTARTTFAETTLLGRELTLIAVFSRDAGNDQTVTLYHFCTCSLELTQLGTDTSTGDSGAIFDSGDYGVGTVGTSTVTGEDSTDYNGTITAVRFYTNQTATLTPSANAYRQRYFFDDGRKAKPSDDIYILPAMTNLQTVGTRLNVLNADERYEPLGRRAYLSASFADFAHTDFIFDPYLSSRTYDPLDRSTFWAKWLYRNKYGKTRAIVNVYSGYDGDALTDMRKQTYIVDRLIWDGRQAQLEARDFLSLTEFRRAQVPAQSTGLLAAEMDESQTSFTITGDVTDEYPTSGTIRIDDELMTYTGISYSSSSGETTFTGVTRGTDGSTAATHDVDELAQICRRYTNQRIDTVLEELLIDDARIPATFVDLAAFTDQYDEYLDAYTLTTLISEPTAVERLVGELAEQCSFIIWWDEREQLVKLQAIRALDPVSVIFTEASNIVRDSFRLEERPKERLTTISFHYNPRDFAGDLEKPTNFKNVLVTSNSRAQGDNLYGRLPQVREVFSRWLTTEAQVNQTTSRISVRFEDVPMYATFVVDARDRQYWVGDYCKIYHDAIVDKNGAQDQSRRWLIIEAEEIEAGHAQRLVAVDITLDGLIYRITENSLTTYTAEDFADANAFITDADGLNPDGSIGATIS